MIDRIALWTLLHNLAVGAALCVSFDLGHDFTDDDYGSDWWPNVEGKEMPR